MSAPCTASLHRPVLGLVVAAALLALACKPQRMAVPTDLASAAQVLQIEERSSATGLLADESFKFGRYRVTDVDRGWTRSGPEWSGWNPFKSRDTTRGGYAFKFSDGALAAEGRCMTSMGQDKLAIPVIGEVTSDVGQIACRCQGAGMMTDGMVEQKGGDSWQGQLNARGGVFALASIMKLESGAATSRPAGFEARDPQRSVAAVETAHPGRVWLASSLDAPTQSDLACLFAGLLLFQPPRDRSGMP